MIDDPFSDLLKTNKRKENISKLNDDLAYEILSVVEEIPAGRVATYGQIAKLIGGRRIPDWWRECCHMQRTMGSFPAIGW